MLLEAPKTVKNRPGAVRSTRNCSQTGPASVPDMCSAYAIDSWHLGRPTYSNRCWHPKSLPKPSNPAEFTHTSRQAERSDAAETLAGCCLPMTCSRPALRTCGVQKGRRYDFVKSRRQSGIPAPYFRSTATSSISKDRAASTKLLRDVIADM